MKKYIVYVNGIEQKGLISAKDHNTAEAKAQKQYGHNYPNGNVMVTVEYTEV